ncbi:hypothetical protein DFQ04_1690 [Algoriphagus boseongensis]|uniref:DUF4270 family protein n=1 Tax=Algoriphagus boseongensis TaxID=1442587 RepID=A0A4R6T5W1_9BACT|nr:hypothetical protein [Algoriphagus boseongensis]TDQ17042.1 hypothetical protein DFQ04_1690 [Algoriphagus boseongensis]
MKNQLSLWTGALASLLMIWACTPTSQQEPEGDQPFQAQLEKLKSSTDSVYTDFIQMTLVAHTLNFYLPAIQSPVMGNVNGLWVLLGGRKSGLHSMDQDPPSFQTLQANDSIWVIDLDNNQSYGIPAPAPYFKYLTASSQQYFQDGNTLYVSGGFTFRDSTSQVSNWTSDAFMEIDLPSLIQYVQSNGSQPALESVVTKFIQDPFLQVTGGEMMVSNGNFYLIGGQNYDSAYMPQKEGKYTNAIRKFELIQGNLGWGITDTLSVIDPVNLHRRDFNLAEVLLPDQDSLGAVIYGGVFTDQDMAYQSPVYITGLGAGNPTVQLDSQLLQQVNLYSSAKINSFLGNWPYRMNRIALFGGITYQALSKDSSSLEIPPASLALPFSNLMSSLYTDGVQESVELVQLPPNSLLPGYLGANAVFIPVTSYLYGNSSTILDLNKVFSNTNPGPVLVGFIYGGILSPAPNTFTPRGPRVTQPNPVLYEVYMSLKDVH